MPDVVWFDDFVYCWLACCTMTSQWEAWVLVV
jgi:hypothetical protein